MSNKEGDPPGKITGKTVPPRRSPATERPGKEPAAMPLHDRSSLVFPDAMKETARQILLLYKQHTGFGMEKLKIAIAGRDCKTLTKDDLKHWLGYRSILGDRKFQYVDAFIRSLDQSLLPDAIRHVLLEQQEGYLRDAMIRALRPGTYSADQKQALHDLLSHSVYGLMFCEVPPQREVKHIAELTIHPWLLFIEIGKVTDGFGPVDILAVRPSRADLTKNYLGDEIFDCVAIGRDVFVRLLSGYLMVTSTGTRVFNWPDAAITLSRRMIPEYADGALSCLAFPDLLTTTCRFINVSGNRLPYLETNFPMPFNSNNSMLPHFRPWIARFYHGYPIEGVDRELAPNHIPPLAPHAVHKWARIGDRSAYDQAIATLIKDENTN